MADTTKGQTPFDALTADDAKKLVGAVQVEDIEELKSYLDGDHWQDGNGWMGPRPGENEAGAAAVLEELERGFVSQNAVKEVDERHVSGVVGYEPQFSLTLTRPLKEDEEPTDAEKATIDEAEAFLTKWWNDRKIHEWLHKAVGALLYNERQCLRLYVPRGLLATEGGSTGTLTVVDIADALSKIFLDMPLPENAAVHTDDDTQKQIGVHVWEAGERKGVELYYLGPDNPDKTKLETFFRSVEEGSDVQLAFLLGGRIPMYQLERRPLITQALLASQRGLNLALSCIPKNVITGGWLERTLLNAQMPGKWEYDAEGARKRFIPEAYTTGPNTTNFVLGVDTTDEDGRTTFTDPQMVYREPVPVTSAVEAKEEFYQSILKEAKQLHVLGSNEAMSGYSREHARADYEASLRITASIVEGLVRWLVETSLAMAEAFLSKPGLYTNQLRCDVTCVLDTGPASPEEMKANTDAVEKGLLSEETAMARNGVVDVDAEKGKINSSQLRKLEIKTKQAAIISQLASVTTIDAIAEWLGMDKKEAQMLAAGNLSLTEQSLEQEANRADISVNADAKRAEIVDKKAPEADDA